MMGSAKGPEIKATQVRKTYRLGKVRVPVLRGVDLSVAPGEFVAVLGASGSGKSTLLHLLGGLDRPDAPEKGAERTQIVVGGRELSRLGAGELDAYRHSSIGFVFQFYHLLPELSVLDNVLLAAMARHGTMGFLSQRGTLRERARMLLGQVGLEKRLTHRPSELSGGERQRVALARALMNEPGLLLADEPTGNLDRTTGQGVLDVLCDLARERGMTMVVVTHDPATAARADRSVRLVDGLVAEGAAV